MNAVLNDEWTMRVCPCCMLVDTHGRGSAEWWGGSYCAECEHIDLNGFPVVGSDEAHKLVLDAIEPLLTRQPISESERNRAKAAFAIVYDEWDWQ